MISHNGYYEDMEPNESFLPTKEYNVLYVPQKKHVDIKINESSVISPYNTKEGGINEQHL
nr:MAG TPA: hypothetical protein [Caudoviricetes sp.]